jgi:rubredoxin
MTTVNLGPTSMMRGRCKRCDWSFDLVALPMSIAEAAAVCRQSCCPMCGAGSSDITVGDSRPLSVAEYAHKNKVLA